MGDGVDELQLRAGGGGGRSSRPRPARGQHRSLGARHHVGGGGDSLLLGGGGGDTTAAARLGLSQMQGSAPAVYHQ